MDRVETAAGHFEHRFCAELLDHQAAAACQNIGLGITVRHVRITVGDRVQHRRAAAHIASTAEGSSGRIGDVELRTGHIEAGAYRSTPLHQKTVHIEAGGNAGNYDREIQTFGVHE